MRRTNVGLPTYSKQNKVSFLFSCITGLLHWKREKLSLSWTSKYYFTKLNRFKVSLCFVQNEVRGKVDWRRMVVCLFWYLF